MPSFVGLCIEKGVQYPIRKASVLFTRDISVGDVHNAYIHVLGNIYVMQQGLVLTDEEIDRLFITDCSEIWRLEIHCISNGENKDEIYNFFGSAFYLMEHVAYRLYPNKHPL